jgi:hypothetical protein
LFLLRFRLLLALLANILLNGRGTLGFIERYLLLIATLKSASPLGREKRKSRQCIQNEFPVNCIAHLQNCPLNSGFQETLQQKYSARI